ncbi:hypothetical protein [Aeromonas salmonicida]|uniref:hypothetical protein n=1 Tax=Aeromonas salmonicida TaxID=645 RepID=UPI0014633B0B|nr:hypothetical protein [Aeromonas salmonicida]QJF56023.1 hypothetical protein GO993_11070 [Aeromonas salmonicida subsp. salmonicida]WCH41197.1 hypothetical protein ONZ57_07315 [Aeromonas salmonicida]WCH53261.1 hypothetical protein ONZ63_06910 [Aeromonas salmonicida]
MLRNMKKWMWVFSIIFLSLASLVVRLVMVLHRAIFPSSPSHHGAATSHPDHQILTLWSAKSATISLLQLIHPPICLLPHVS